MKRIVTLFLCLCLLIPVCACAPAATVPEDADAVTMATTWIEKQIEENTLMSFRFNDKEYASHIPSWDKTVDQTDNGWVVRYTKDGVSVWSEIKFDRDSAALEWTNYFKNESGSDSPVIADIYALDSTVHIPNPVLTSADGSRSLNPDEFQPNFFNLTEQPELTIKNTGGRSSQGAFPYFDICNGTHGIMGAIGWTGTWKLNVKNSNGAVHMQAGMQNTKISLHNGEEIRTPAILIQFFKGDQDAGHNALRQLILKSYTPKDADGETLKRLPMCMNAWGGIGEERLMTDHLKKYEKNDIPYEVFWVDAGWHGDVASGNVFEDVWSKQVGDWYYNPEYPENGFANISRYLAERDKQLLLWFEPERASLDSKLYTEHTDYFLPVSTNASDAVYNMGNDEAREYLTDMIVDILVESGVSWYRQDFNTDPAEVWISADNRAGENREGMTEIRYVTGLYTYLDALLERVPGLLIDNCASGGRRLDFEMMKRSVPLWRTDYTPKSDKSSNADGVRTIACNLTWWLPLNAGGPGDDGMTTNYHFRSLASAGMTVWGANDFLWLRSMVEQYNSYRDMMLGDYYLLSIGRDREYNSVNCVYEYYLPEEGRGYLMAFRPARSRTDRDTYLLKGLDAQAQYKFTVVDTDETFTLSGEQLMTGGLGLSFPVAELSHLILFEKVS